MLKKGNDPNILTKFLLVGISMFPSNYVAIALGLLLLFAAALKLVNFQQTRGLHNAFFPALSIQATSYLSGMIIAAESLFGSGLLVNAKTFAPGAAILFLVFSTGALVIRWKGPDNLDCGCFGGIVKTRISYALVFRNLALALLATTLWKGPAPSIWIIAFAMLTCSFLVPAIPRWKRSATRIGITE